MAKIKLPNLEVTEESRKESEVRVFLFMGKHITDKFKQTYTYLKINSIDPYTAILTKSEEMYKLLHNPLGATPTQDKNSLAARVNQNILDIRSHLIRSATIDSRSIQEAIECSCALTELYANLDLMCGLTYISNNFYSKLYEHVATLDLLLQIWFDVLKHYKESKADVKTTKEQQTSPQ